METLKLNKKNVNKHYSLFYLNVLVCLNFKFTIEKGRKTSTLKIFQKKLKLNCRPEDCKNILKVNFS